MNQLMDLEGALDQVTAGDGFTPWIFSPFGTAVGGFNLHLGVECFSQYGLIVENVIISNLDTANAHEFDITVGLASTVVVSLAGQVRRRDTGQDTTTGACQLATSQTAAANFSSVKGNFIGRIWVPAGASMLVELNWYLKQNEALMIVSATQNQAFNSILRGIEFMNQAAKDFYLARML